MKLGEALAELKREQSRLARLVVLRKQNIFTDEGKNPSFDPSIISQEIDVKIGFIRSLKLSIQRTNIATTLQGEQVSLAEAIIKINDIRSMLAHLATLFEKKSDFFYREKNEKDKIAHLNEQEIEEEMKRLEKEKVRLDNKIQMTNWTTELIH